MDNVDLQTFAGLFIRHALTTLGGILAAHGYLGSSTTEQFVSAAMVIIGILWSWWQKSGQIALMSELGELRRRVSARAQADAIRDKIAAGQK